LALLPLSSFGAALAGAAFLGFLPADAAFGAFFGAFCLARVDVLAIKTSL
jgi:hypothetical protein